MTITKTQLTFEEVFNFINDVVESTFGKDENGNDVEFRPMARYTAIQYNFCHYYTDLEFTDDFDTNYELYMGANIGYYVDNKEINDAQWNYISRSIDQEIDFRKQKLLQTDNSVSKYVADLLKAQIENTKLQKQVLEQTSEMNKSFTKEDMDGFTTAMKDFNTNFNNPEFQKQLVSALVKFNSKTKPKDHKKSSTAK